MRHGARNWEWTRRTVEDGDGHAQRDGLALAHEIGRGAPLVYYSLELLLSYELSTPAERQLKAQERELSRRAVCVVVQDAARGRLLAEDNGLGAERLALVPNAPALRVKVRQIKNCLTRTPTCGQVSIV